MKSAFKDKDVLPAFERRFVACAVPDVQNLNALRFLADVVENTIRTNHDFAQRTSRAAGIRWSNVRKVCQNSNVREYTTPDSNGRLRVMLGNIVPDALKVRDGRVRPDYLEVHAVAQDSSRCSASSWVFVRPAAMSARPRRTDAMMRNSSVISSREAVSGSLCKASSTACLSVMSPYYGIPRRGASACKQDAEIRL